MSEYPHLSCRLFGPGLPASGRLARVHVAPEGLLVDGAPPVDWQRLTAVQGGFDHHQLQLTWRDAEGAGPWALVPNDASAQAQLIAQIPEAAVPSLRRWHQATGSQRWVWRSVVGTLVSLALLAVIGVWQYDRLMDWATWQIPQSVDEKLGRAVWEQVREEQHLLLDDAPIVGVVRSMGERLTQGSSYAYRWHVAVDDSINAFALPGGTIVVHSGLIQAAGSADELAAVLAHEVAHVERRHPLRGLVNQGTLAAGAALVLGDVSSIVAIMAHQVGALYYSRAMESEADTLGFHRLRERGIVTAPMLTMFDKLKYSHEARAEAAGARASAPAPAALPRRPRRRRMRGKAPAHREPSRPPVGSTRTRRSTSAWVPSAP